MKVSRNICLAFLLLMLLHGCDSMSDDGIQETPIAKNDIYDETPPDDDNGECDWVEDYECEPPEPDGDGGGASGPPWGGGGGGTTLPPLPPPTIIINDIHLWSQGGNSSPYATANLYSQTNVDEIPPGYVDPKLEVTNVVTVRKRASESVAQISLSPGWAVETFETEENLFDDFRNTAALAYQFTRVANYDCFSVSGNSTYAKSFFITHKVDAATVGHHNGQALRSIGTNARKLSNLKIC